MAPRSRVLAIGVGVSQQGNRGRDSAAAFAAFRAGGADIIGILAWQLQPNSQRVLGRHSLENKLPAIHQFRAVVEPGCPASYAVGCSPPTPPRVLKDAKLANLPVEQRADEMIE